MHTHSDPIEIVSYDPIWPLMFATEARRLHTALPRIVQRIDHIGSTAVTGIAAKPVIDMLLTVQHSTGQLEAITALNKLEYNERPESPPSDLCFMLRRNSLGVRTYHLHVVTPTAQEDQRLLLRDFLRADNACALEYEKLKCELAIRFQFDREAYIDGKTAFIHAALERANAWRKSNQL